MSAEDKSKSIKSILESAKKRQKTTTDLLKAHEKELDDAVKDMDLTFKKNKIDLEASVEGMVQELNYWERRRQGIALLACRDPAKRDQIHETSIVLNAIQKLRDGLANPSPEQSSECEAVETGTNHSTPRNESDSTPEGKTPCQVAISSGEPSDDFTKGSLRSHASRGVKVRKQKRTYFQFNRRPSAEITNLKKEIKRKNKDKEQKTPLTKSSEDTPTNTHPINTTPKSREKIVQQKGSKTPTPDKNKTTTPRARSVLKMKGKRRKSMSKETIGVSKEKEITESKPLTPNPNAKKGKKWWQIWSKE